MSISEILYQGPLITKASNALILLHGRGGTARGILNLADKLCGNDFYVMAPQAINHSWYPQSFLVEEKFNEPYLSQSVKSIHDLIEETAKHIPKTHIYIVGFSQGACLALEVSSRFATRYGGIVSFTGGLIGSTVEESKYQGDFEGTNVFMSNGDQDPHIPLIRSEESRDVMKRLGANVTLKVYKDRAHIIGEDEIKWVKKNIMHPL
jgi:phospholipase/carboxylesterase